MRATALYLAIVAVCARCTATPVSYATSGNTAAINKVTPKEWAALKTAVGGRLYPLKPWPSPCYSAYNNGTSTVVQTPDLLGGCKTVQSDYTDPPSISNQPAGYHQPNWAACLKTSQSCNLNSLLPQDPTYYAPPAVCYQGSVPSYYIDVRQNSDVQAALAFSQYTGVPLVVKSTGHDYKGRSSAPNSLMLWMHNLKALTYSDSYVASGCAASTATSAITMGAGTQFIDAYNFADSHNKVIVGGSSETVGITGGWLAGVGHSALSNTLGLGSDNVLSITAVTGKGQVLTATRCSNQGLFFAMRGGGTSYAVLMSATFKAHPAVTLQTAYIRFVTANLNGVEGFVKTLIANQQAQEAAGFGGYIVPGAMGTQQAAGLILFTPSVNLTTAQAVMKPVTDYVQNTFGTGNVPLTNQVTTTGSFLQTYKSTILPNQEKSGISLHLASRLVPKTAFKDAPSQAALLSAVMNAVKTLVPIVPGVATLGLYDFTANPAQILVTTPANYKTDGTGSANPAWYSSSWHFPMGSGFADTSTSAQSQTAYALTQKAIAPLRAITPIAAYQNEADSDEPNYTQSFWGSNYANLLKAKQAYDPLNLIQHHQGVGYNASDPRYSCFDN
ncbi:uncharacterized protein L969DRAFT_44860 [Mixia osmundae IAM 14324]|uniref:FAD-binding PCMH-type domain-containing protein n=1 Tax=Mixia osmundae (strain CBS 9802 / IAM 14324 / JCM 22182 / KY 12970) TaxID=764103 RepID=G7DYG0_MIXOS|nr:uncharacterized protein L969DRAFT_44860 [Mixia osmundae IAM 14324]KEI41522.1 hypothetical protein L969DRAFT_44860 [Mixia osmundae IAM 14324]GAA95620.1 hypothetical protein E5Q_02276 [Mixia osmundae IAM 14324]